MKTVSTKQSDIKRSWWHINASDEVLGRLASQAAQLLIGKHKPHFVPYLDCGDYVVVTNADRIIVTGRKRAQKIYYSHSGYPGGLKSLTLDQLMAKDSRKVIYQAVLGMVPKNKLRAVRMKRLKLFKTGEHKFQDKKLTEYKNN